MSFEVKEEDMLARIGKLKTKSGTIETPTLLPVISPTFQIIPPRSIGEKFGFDAIITNAYILKKRFQNQIKKDGLHQFLDFDGSIMTDSGAYQILIYGDVEVEPREIVEYQEHIGSDVATILDIPTGWKVTEECADKTVKETLKRAKDFCDHGMRDDILWVGPVQGGRFLNLVAKSAKEMGRLPFQIHALGSPTEVMERYRFDVLVDMILTAKKNLPINRPLHLFGAGHPFMFSLAIALGCDIFDSAAYALYAKEGRYMTETGTARLEQLTYFPCACRRCTEATPSEVAAMPDRERHAFLAEHNLYTCSAELKRVKQAIEDGRLWELLQLRAHSHPTLFQALHRLGGSAEFIEKHNPSAKPSGLFCFDSADLSRPEVTRHRRLLTERYAPPEEADSLMLFPQTRTKPFHKSKVFREKQKNLDEHSEVKNAHVCFYAAPFGIVPIELDEVYPLSQHETALPLDRETIDYVAKQVHDYIARTRYDRVILVNDPENWGKSIINACKRACRKKGVTFKSMFLSEL